MQLISRFGRAFWIGLLLIGLAVVVWFIAPQAQSCVTDIDTTACETIWVVVLNVLGLILFVVGGGLMFLAAARARAHARHQRPEGGDDTR